MRVNFSKPKRTIVVGDGVHHLHQAVLWSRWKKDFRLSNKSDRVGAVIASGKNSEHQVKALSACEPGDEARLRRKARF